MIFIRLFAKVFIFIRNDFHLSPFPIVHINISRYLTKGGNHEKILNGASLEKKLYVGSILCKKGHLRK